MGKPEPGGGSSAGSGSPLAALPTAPAYYVQQADGSLRAVHAADAHSAGADSDDDVAVYDAEDFLLPPARPARPSWRLSLGAASRPGAPGATDGGPGGAGASAYAGTLPRLSWAPASSGTGLSAVSDTLYCAVAGGDRAGDDDVPSSRPESLSREGPSSGLAGGWGGSGAAAEPESRVTSQTPLTRGAAEGPYDAGLGLGFPWGAAATRRPRQPGSSRARSALTRWLRPR